MSCSPAQLAANRQNSKRSTGPKSPEGKSISRCNALKHGLTGEGVALPSEDQAEIEQRYEDLSREMKPSTRESAILLRRFAFMSVRIERCERNDTAELSERVRHAIARFDDERLAEVEALVAKLYMEPATTVRRLQMTPEGIDRLLDEWEVLRADLNHEDRNRWTQNHRAHFDILLGRNPGGYRVARIMALSEAMGGYFQYLEKADGEGLEGPARSDWARVELTRLIDVEMARLKEARVSLDPGAIARDRAEAPDRALFDPSPERTLARKYEAATERAMYKALKEFHQAEAAAGANRGESPGEPEPEESGSFFPEPAEETPEAEVIDEITPTAPPLLPFAAHQPLAQAVDDGPSDLGSRSG